MSNPIVSFDEQAVKDELRELVRKTIEETINAMLDEEADQLVGAGPYERTDERARARVRDHEARLALMAVKILRVQIADGFIVLRHICRLADLREQRLRQAVRPGQRVERDQQAVKRIFAGTDGDKDQ